MRYPVFLTNSHLNHMPIGSQNEWSEFFHSASFELEADSFIPILWFMLFRDYNLQWAKFTDLLDHNDERNQLDLEANRQEYGDHHYAYLVVDQEQALMNLDNNQSIFIDTFGTDHLVHFETFKAKIQQYYPEYILLRSSGLGLEWDNADLLIYPLQQIANFQYNQNTANQFIEHQQLDFERFDDYAYFFSGIDRNNMEYESQDQDQADLEQDTVTDIQKQPADKTSGIAVWICTAIVSILTLAVWYKTESVLYSFILFIVSAFILGFISSILGKPKAIDQTNSSDSTQ